MNDFELVQVFILDKISIPSPSIHKITIGKYKELLFCIVYCNLYFVWYIVGVNIAIELCNIEQFLNPKYFYYYFIITFGI